MIFFYLKTILKNRFNQLKLRESTEKNTDDLIDCFPRLTSLWVKNYYNMKTTSKKVAKSQNGSKKQQS